VDALEAEQRVVEALRSAPEHRRDPVGLLRSVPLAGCRYAVVRERLADPRLRTPAIEGDTPLLRMFARTLLQLEGERHQRVRARFARLFSARRVECFRAGIEARAAALIDAIEPRGRADLVADFCRPLPFAVIADVLGVPAERRDWVAANMHAMRAGFYGDGEPEAIVRAVDAVTDLLDGFTEMLAARVAAPRGDRLSILAGDPPADAEELEDVVANCVFFIEAGHATITSMVSGAALLLLEHPDEQQRVLADPELVRGTVEEALRLISPVTAIPRCAASGPARWSFLAAANRDPRIYADPDRFNPARRPNPHLAFSHGPHFCLGAALTRLHGDIAVTALLRRLRGLRLDGAPEWGAALPLHELARLPVRWG
jgi:cytochrome P450